MSRPLDHRLAAVAVAVRSGSVAADVGTDHGYLICHLVAAGKCPGGYASDLRPQPLESARQHIAQQGLTDKIQTVLSDGLHGLPEGRIDDVIIAGMGGDLIGEILTAVPWTRDPDKRYVLQPMTRAPQLRRFLYANGFGLLAETAVASAGFLYTVMTAAYTGEEKQISEAFAHCGLLLDDPCSMARQYREMVCARLRKQTEGLQRSAKRSG